MPCPRQTSGAYSGQRRARRRGCDRGGRPSTSESVGKQWERREGLSGGDKDERGWTGNKAAREEEGGGRHRADCHIIAATFRNVKSSTTHQSLDESERDGTARRQQVHALGDSERFFGSRSAHMWAQVAQSVPCNQRGRRGAPPAIARCLTDRCKLRHCREKTLNYSARGTAVGRTAVANLAKTQGHGLAMQRV